MITRESVRGVYPVVPLEEAAEFLDHLRKPVKQSDRVEGPYPYYGANGLQGTIDGFLFDEPLVLVAEDGGHFDTPERGIAYQIEGKSWVNNHAHVLRPKGNVDIRFLTRVLENYDVRPFINGSTRAKLTKGQAKNIEIPLPPLEEQKRIAGILDQADALRRLRTRALDKLNTLGQAIFHDMFGDPAIEPDRWPSAPLSEFASTKEDIKCGPFGTQLLKSEFVEHGVPLWGIKQVNRHFRVQTYEFITQEKFKDISTYSIKPDDIIMTRKGTVGNCAVYPRDFPTGVMHSDLLRLRVDRKRYMPAFVADQLRFNRSFGHQLKLISGGAIMAGINVSRLKALHAISPPYELQQVYSERIRSSNSERKKLIHAQSVLETLFASLQHRAFRGKL